MREKGFVRSQITKTLGSRLIKYRSDNFASDRYLYDVDPRVLLSGIKRLPFAIWAVSCGSPVVLRHCVVRQQLSSCALDQPSTDPPLGIAAYDSGVAPSRSIGGPA